MAGQSGSQSGSGQYDKGQRSEKDQGGQGYEKRHGQGHGKDHGKGQGSDKHHMKGSHKKDMDVWAIPALAVLSREAPAEARRPAGVETSIKAV